MGECTPRRLAPSPGTGRVASTQHHWILASPRRAHFKMAEDHRLSQQIAQILDECQLSHAFHSRKLKELAALRSSGPPNCFFPSFSSAIIPLFEFSRWRPSSESAVRFIAAFAAHVRALEVAYDRTNGELYGSGLLTPLQFTKEFALKMLIMLENPPLDLIRMIIDALGGHCNGLMMMVRKGSLLGQFAYYGTQLRSILLGAFCVENPLQQQHWNN
ncbi:hypothetical protein KSP40_PGU009952 [Platanthera guangdongensis]|uniref:Uncharacterized protein n=1 Tax=Platanthera guangdongensis TaxID=2320717 RepID=A0ABR2MVI8_9ASPA